MSFMLKQVLTSCKLKTDSTGNTDFREGKRKFIGSAVFLCYNDMEKIDSFVLRDVESSPWFRPRRVEYVQNGVKKTWDCMKVHDCVSILLYHAEKDALIFVKQFRPAIYLERAMQFMDAKTKEIDVQRVAPSLGVSLELCAGIVDKPKSLVEIACDEVLEECGYSVLPEHMEHVTSFRNGVAVSASLHTLFFATVTEQQHVATGGGCADEGELIELVEIPVANCESTMMDESIARSPVSLFAVLWFLERKRSALIASKAASE